MYESAALSFLKNMEVKSMSDHNDWADDFVKYTLMSESTDGGKVHGPSGGAVFGVVVAICIGIVLLALVLGVEIPGAVIELFLKIILGVGFFAVLGFVFKKR